jgi:hypothetical protein
MVRAIRVLQKVRKKVEELGAKSRDARWHIFKPKIPIWLNFGRSCNGRCWSILWPFGIGILRPFGIFYGYLVYFPRFGMLYQEKSGNPVRRVLRHFEWQFLAKALCLVSGKRCAIGEIKQCGREHCQPFGVLNYLINNESAD